MLLLQLELHSLAALCTAISAAAEAIVSISEAISGLLVVTTEAKEADGETVFVVSRLRRSGCLHMLLRLLSVIFGLLNEAGGSESTAMEEAVVEERS
jgi:hypothetical protein